MSPVFEAFYLEGPEVYPEPCQTSKLERLPVLIDFSQHPILDI